MRVWRNLEKNKQMIRIAAQSGCFIVCDTETTGLGATDEIIEFAGCKLHYVKGRFCIYESVHYYIKPSKKMTEDVVNIHGISNEFLEDKPTADKVCPKIEEFLGKAPILGAYNSGFDVGKLSYMYKCCNKELKVKLEIDLLQIARDVFCEVKLPNHKLGTIAEAYGVTEGIRFHSAMDDVIVLIRVLNAMVKDMQLSNDTVSLRKVKVYKLSYYKGYRGNSRLYVKTSVGSVYYELMYDRWTTSEEKVQIGAIDMKDLEKQVFQMAGCKDYAGLRKAAPGFVSE